MFSIVDILYYFYFNSKNNRTYETSLNQYPIHRSAITIDVDAMPDCDAKRAIMYIMHEANFNSPMKVMFGPIEVCRDFVKIDHETGEWERQTAPYEIEIEQTVAYYD